LSKDIHLTRWSNLLTVMAVFTAVLTVMTAFYPLIFNGPLGLVKDNGAKVWTTTVQELPVFERLTVVFTSALYNFAWLYALVQIVRLARHFRAGHIFAEANARCFVRIGAALGLMGILQTLTYPLLNYFLYWRGISPWLGDMSLLDTIHPDYVMAGVFFFVLGKIMRRASELEESDRLMI
jgi:hypothetical protein